MKKIYIIISLVFVCILISSTFVSAWWLGDFFNNFWNKISGHKVVQYSPIYDTNYYDIARTTQAECQIWWDDVGKTQYQSLDSYNATKRYDWWCMKWNSTSQNWVGYGGSNNACNYNIPIHSKDVHNGCTAYGKLTGDINETILTCSDGIKNQDETDIDCGGATCSKCITGKICSSITDCTKGLMCINGKCSAKTCNDSDGGNNIYTKGTVIGLNSFGDPFLGVSDFCDSAGKIVEYYCSVTNVVSSQKSCPSGRICSDGACVSTLINQTIPTGSLSVSSIPSGASFRIDGIYRGLTPLTLTNLSVGNHNVTVNIAGYYAYIGTKSISAGANSLNVTLTSATSSLTCTDSDGGLNYPIKGNTTGLLGTGTTATGTMSDQCNGPNLLLERYCKLVNSVLVVFTQGYNCTNGYSCSDGACVFITPTCTDGTFYGNCSVNKSKYCSNGTLINNCGLCGGCSLNEVCLKSGICLKVNDKIPPTISYTSVTPSSAPSGAKFIINSVIFDLGTGIGSNNPSNSSLISSVNPPKAYIQKSDNGTDSYILTLYDDGNHGDMNSEDGNFGIVWDSSGKSIGTYYVSITAEDIFGNKKNSENITSFNISSNINCISVIENGDFTEKIDVIFVPDGFITKEDMIRFANEIIPYHMGLIADNDGILQLEPFKSNADRFNFYYINKSNDFKCLSSSTCKKSDVYKTVTQNCISYDEIIVLENNSDGIGYSYLGAHFAVGPGKKISSEFPIYWQKYPQGVTVHEFAHSFGGLKDEYTMVVPDFAYTDYPPCDVYGCPKWCNGTPNLPEPPWQECLAITNKITCNQINYCNWNDYNNLCTIKKSNYGNFSEGLNCIDGAECWHNCHGTNSFRSSSISRMNSVWDDNQFPTEFNKISKEHLNKIFKCCYPKSIEEFNSINCSKFNEDNLGRYQRCTLYKGSQYE